MATMISEVYETFRVANVPEDKARRAAEALTAESLATKADVARLEKEIVGVKSGVVGVRADLLLVKWMLGLVIVMEVLPYLKAVLG